MPGKILTRPNLSSIPLSTMGEFCFQTAKQFENRICHIDAITNQHETYFEFNQRSIRVALAMTKLGVVLQDVVVVCSTITLDTPVPLVASFYIGAIVANLDPSLSVRQTSHLLSLVSPKIIFVEEASVNLIEKSLLEAKLETEVVVFGESEKYKTFSSLNQPQTNEHEFRPKSADVEETCILIFSSGSTGLPKAICHSHRSFLTASYNFYKSGSKFDTILSFSSFYWVSAMIFLVTSFIHGGRRILCGSTVKPKQLFHNIEKYKITFIFLAPVLTYGATNFPDYKNYDTSSLYTVLCGGTAISATQLRKVHTVFEHSDVIFAYGLTETGLLTLFDPTTDKELITRKIGCCGKVTFGCTLKIVDVETNEILGTNQKGEIRLKSSTMMKEYYRADSSQDFDEEGFLKTGDIGYYDEDECLYVVDRLKEMFKYLSWHIVPTAIENVLFEHPGVKEAIVFGLPKNEEEGEVPTASVVLEDGCRVTEKEIEEFVAGKVSDKEKLRGGVYFVKSIPRTPTGKVIRKKVRDDLIQSLEINKS